MELVAEKTAVEAKVGMNGVSIVVFGFVIFSVGVFFPPLALVVLFSCVLRMLIKIRRSEAVVIENDSDPYRLYIRPVARCLVWAPVAALIVFVLFCAIPILMFALPVAIPLGLIWFAVRGSLSANKKAIALREQNNEITAGSHY
jgi:hypothetical protein